MPLSAYNLWLSRSAIGDTAYAGLKNGIIFRRNGTGSEEVQILCDHEQLTNLIEYAQRVCPEVVSYISSISNTEM
jgi:hypothetical protein